MSSWCTGRTGRILIADLRTDSVGYYARIDIRNSLLHEVVMEDVCVR